MGCPQSKQKDVIQEGASSLENSYGELPLDDVDHIQSIGRVGILPSPITSSSSDEENSRTRSKILILHNWTAEPASEEIDAILGDDEWSVEPFESNDETPRRPSSNSNQSMDDDLLREESVVDWLAESNALPFTSTETSAWPAHISSVESYRGRDPIFASAFNLGDILAGPKRDEEKHVVKDTTRVERRHVPLPINKPSATRGDWLTNRYVVNDYIVLSEIGKGAHAEVRLCKHKITNEIFAAKIMNRKLLRTKFVDVSKEIAIMKTLMHPNGECDNIKRCVLPTYLDIDLIAFSTFTGRNLITVLRLYEVLDDPKGAGIQPVVLHTSHAPSKNIHLTSYHQSTRFI